jgi:hypothetical protein
MSSTMQAVVKPEAAPGAEIREVKIPAFGRHEVTCIFTTGTGGRRAESIRRSFRGTSSAGRWRRSATK